LPDGGRVQSAEARAVQHGGLRWLREVRWPLSAIVLDGELYSGEGMDGIVGILRAR
jgi:hypothetical protein